MTTTERSHWLLSVVLSIVLATHLLWTFGSSAQPPQPLAPDRWRDGFDVIQFENGSTWYLRDNSIQAIWAVPRDEQERLGYATKIYGTGYHVISPDEVNVILKALLGSEKQQLENLLEELEQAK